MTIRCNFSRLDPRVKPRVTGPRTDVEARARVTGRKALAEAKKAPLIPPKQFVKSYD